MFVIGMVNRRRRRRRRRLRRRRRQSMSRRRRRRRRCRRRRRQSMSPVYSYYVRFVNGIHERWVFANQVALSETLLRRGNDVREERVHILPCIVVRQYSGVVDLGLIYCLQGVFVRVLGLKLSYTFST